jgi:adenylate cyclase
MARQMSATPTDGWRFMRELLAERNQFPDRAAAIDARLRDRFERTVAVLVLDMCGFSRLTERHGVMHYLAMIAQMTDAATPAVRNNHGTVLKVEADNLFAIFPTAEDALEGALDVFLAFEAVNSVVGPERDIRGSVGIGFGPLMVIDDQDCFGPEMNNACRLGEDLAKGPEILLTPAAVAALPSGHYAFEALTYTYKDKPVAAHRFARKLVGELPDSGSA